MENTIQTLATVISNLRDLFRDKDRLVGVDDWDNFIGCLCALEKIGNELQAMSTADRDTQENTAEE